MQYLFLLWGDEDAEMEKTADDRHAVIAAHREFAQGLRAAGRSVSGEAVGPSRDAIVVRRTGRAASATDGPFLETKEQLGGFYVIDCVDGADAIAVAGDIPASPGLVVEVRTIPD
jgi:hypothetical protein